MTVSEFRYPSSDGKNSVYAREWLPEKEIKGVIQIAHGILEHIGRYDRFADFFTDKGYVVVGNDHLGHGRTVADEKDLGYAADKDGWLFFIRDVKGLYDIERERYPDKPYFMLGHSMGSFIMRCFAIMYPQERVAGYVFSGTCNTWRFVTDIGLSICRRQEKKYGPRGYSKKMKQLAFGEYNKQFTMRKTEFDWLSRDEDEVQKYIMDPLCGFEATLSLYRDLLSLIKYMTDMNNIRKMDKDIPITFISGTRDPVGDNSNGVRSIYKKLKWEGFTDIYYHFYKDARHELFNETCRLDVFHDLYWWLTEKIKKFSETLSTPEDDGE